MLSEAYRSAGPSTWRQRRGRSRWPVQATIALICLPISVLLVALPSLAGTAVVAGIAIFIISFASAQAGLYIIVFSMLLSPEIAVGSLGGHSAALSRRGVTVRVEDLLLVVLGFAWLMRAALYKLGLVRHTPLNRPIVYYIAVCVFATSVGLMTGKVTGMTPFFYLLKYIEYFVLYFIVVNNVDTTSQIKRFTWALLLTGFIVSVVAMAQIPGGGRVTAPFEGDHGEPNTLGGYLIFVGAVAAGLSLNLERSKMRHVLRGLLVVMFIPYVFTLSRGSYLALPFVYLTLVALHKRSRGVMVLMLVVLVAVVATAVPKTVRDRLTGTFTDASYQARYGAVSLGGVAVDASTSARIENWTEALETVMESPIWGLGVTGYGFVDAQYPRVLVEVGFLGLALFILLIATVFRGALKVIRQTPDSYIRGLAVGVVAGTVGLLVHAVAANTFTIVRIMEPFWLSVGLVAAAANIDDVERSLQPLKRSSIEA